MLFCNTCIRNEDEKCFICGYDIACENRSGNHTSDEFEAVTLKQCDYAVFHCEFDNEIALPDAHEKPDAAFWDEWLNENPYVCPIDDLENCAANGYAAIERYLPFDIHAQKFTATMWYPIERKES